jgi:hypothetical protein
MSQEARLRLAAWQPPRTTAEVPERLRLRRFSEGLERAVLDQLRVPRIGRFSTGHEQHPDAPANNRIGRLSRGEDRRRDDDPANLHVGSYADRSDPDAARPSPRTAAPGRHPRPPPPRPASRRR